MQTFDEATLWITAVTSSLVLVLSLLLLRMSLGRAAKNGTAANNDAIAKAVAGLRRRLSESNVSGELARSSHSRFDQDENSRLVELRTSKERVRGELADRIRVFSESLRTWCEVVGGHLAVEDVVRPLLKEFRLLGDETRQGMRDPAELRMEFYDQAAKALTQVLRITDQDFAGDPELKRRLDTSVHQLAECANLDLITPGVGERFDKQKHFSHRSGTATAGRGIVSHVTARGLARTDEQGRAKVLLKAEVEVDN